MIELARSGIQTLKTLQEHQKSSDFKKHQTPKLKNFFWLMDQIEYGLFDQPKEFVVQNPNYYIEVFGNLLMDEQWTLAKKLVVLQPTSMKEYENLSVLTQVRPYGETPREIDLITTVIDTTRNKRVTPIKHEKIERVETTWSWEARRTLVPHDEQMTDIIGGIYKIALYALKRGIVPEKSIPVRISEPFQPQLI